MGWFNHNLRNIFDESIVIWWTFMHCNLLLFWLPHGLQSGAKNDKVHEGGTKFVRCFLKPLVKKAWLFLVGSGSKITLTGSMLPADCWKISRLSRLLGWHVRWLQACTNPLKLSWLLRYIKDEIWDPVPGDFFVIIIIIIIIFFRNFWQFRKLNQSVWQSWNV